MSPFLRKSASGQLPLLALLLLILLPWPALSGAASLSGRVSDVYEGYRLLLLTDDGRRVSVTLNGLTHPNNISRSWKRIAKRHLHMLLAGRVVTVDYTMKSPRGVILGLVRHGGADVGLRMLQDGMATFDRRSLLPPTTRDSYQQAQDDARRRAVGYWQPAR